MSQTKKDCVIIDTGCANLNSVKYALERLNASIEISDDPEIINSASRLILPGVGSAKAAMESLHNKQLIKVIQHLQQPVLGICLGMQLLSNSSNEGNQTTPCLGILDTNITQLNSKERALPHMGWNQLIITDHPLFQGLTQNSYVYFVHSYRAPVSHLSLAQCQYGETFSAAIGKNNFMGVQFHPEKSAATGSTILNNFLELTL